MPIYFYETDICNIGIVENDGEITNAYYGKLLDMERIKKYAYI